MIEKDPMKFYGFNDNYFMSLVHKHFMNGDLDKNPKIKDMAKVILLATGGKAIRCEEFKSRLLSQDDPQALERYYKKAHNKFLEIEDFLSKKGGPLDWVISDIPKKAILFVKSPKNVAKNSSAQLANVLLDRDPVKVSMEKWRG